MELQSLSYDQDPRRPTPLIAGGVVVSLAVSIAAGTNEPVDFTTLANFAKTDEEDGHELQEIAKGVRDLIERQLELALIDQTLTVVFKGPAMDLRMPRIPAKIIAPATSAITEVKEITAGVEGAEDLAAEYYVEGDRILRKNRPAIRPGITLKVVYTAGFSPVPFDIKHAIKVMCTTQFDLRESVVVGTIAREISGAGMESLAHYRR